MNGLNKKEKKGENDIKQVKEHSNGSVIMISYERNLVLNHTFGINLAPRKVPTPN